jgi:cysteine-S-conjugate beta-lyase
MMQFDFNRFSEAELRQRSSFKWTEYPPDVIPAFVAEMDLPICPSVSAALERSLATHDLGYVPYAAKVNFGGSVANWFGREWGWQPQDSWAHMVPDVVVGLDMAVQELTIAGDGVIINPPIYPPFQIVSRLEGRVQVQIPLLQQGSRWMLDLERIGAAFADGSAKVIALCHPHNPTGAVFTAVELDGLIALAHRYGCFIVSDEIHAPLVFDGPFHSVSSRPGAEDVVITVTSTSKAWNTAGLKCATLVCGNEAMARRFDRPAIIKRPGTGLLGLVAMRAAMADGEPWRLAVLEHLRANRDHVVRRLTIEAPDLVVHVPESTYLTWVDCSSLKKPDTAGWMLSEAKVAFSAGSTFGPQWSSWIRWNFGTTTDLLDATIDRVLGAIHR